MKEPKELFIFETGFHDGFGNSEAILFDEPGEKRIHVIPMARVQKLLDALEFECDGTCARGINPCNARETLNEFYGVEDK